MSISLYLGGLVGLALANTVHPRRALVWASALWAAVLSLFASGACRVGPGLIPFGVEVALPFPGHPLLAALMAALAYAETLVSAPGKPAQPAVIRLLGWYPLLLAGFLSASTLLSAFIFLELATLLTVILIAQSKPYWARVYAVFQLLGGGLLLVALLAPVGPVRPLAVMALALKGGFLGLHWWLPGTHAEVGTPTSIVLSAVMVNLAPLTLVRLGLPASQPLVVWGGLQVALAALSAVRQPTAKRLLAFSTISQMGYALILPGAGAPPELLFLHLAVHTLAKALLFGLAGKERLTAGWTLGLWVVSALWLAGAIPSPALHIKGWLSGAAVIWPGRWLEALALLTALYLGSGYRRLAERRTTPPGPSLADLIPVAGMAIMTILWPYPKGPGLSWSLALVGLGWLAASGWLRLPPASVHLTDTILGRLGAGANAAAGLLPDTAAWSTRDGLRLLVVGLICVLAVVILASSS